MLASKEFDQFVDNITAIPHQMAIRLRANAASAEGQASTFRSHFNIFDGVSLASLVRTLVCGCCEVRCSLGIQIRLKNGGRWGWFGLARPPGIWIEWVIRRWTTTLGLCTPCRTGSSVCGCCPCIWGVQTARAARCTRRSVHCSGCCTPSTSRHPCGGNCDGPWCWCRQRGGNTTCCLVRPGDRGSPK
jgi:hypothetical protein